MIVQAKQSHHGTHHHLFGGKKETKASKRVADWTGTYVAEEGPRSGFSRSGWKAKRPRKPAAQLELCLGQSFTYMVTRKMATQATVAADTSHGDHRR